MHLPDRIQPQRLSHRHEAIANYKSLLGGDSQELRDRGFDFSQDYRLLNELGQTLFERAKRERGESRRERRVELLREAVGYFEDTLKLDPENVSAHFNLDLLYKQLGEPEKAAQHLALYRDYKPDDNARDQAVAAARKRDPAADHAAEAIVIYELGTPWVGDAEAVLRPGAADGVPPSDQE